MASDRCGHRKAFSPSYLVNFSLLLSFVDVSSVFASDRVTFLEFEEFLHLRYTQNTQNSI